MTCSAAALIAALSCCTQIIAQATDDAAATASVSPPKQPLAGHVTVKDGRPVLMADDRLLATSYADTFPWLKRMHQRNQRFAERGVALYHLAVRGGVGDDHWTTRFWRDEGVFGDESDMPHYASLRRQAEAILEVNPEAVFLIRWHVAAPHGWSEANPDHMQQTAAGDRLDAVSYASTKFLRGQARMIEALMRYVRNEPWGHRVIGYVAIPRNEGNNLLWTEKRLFEHSPVMRKAFRRFLREKYETVESLRRAWNEPEVTFDSAAIPTEAQWRADRAEWLHWPDPAGTQRYRDYFLLQRRLQLRYNRHITEALKANARKPIIAAIDTFKQPMMGWLLANAFQAAGDDMDFPNMLLSAGSIDVGPMLDMPSLDAVMTPADYTSRSVGFGFEPEGIGDSLVLRGKTILVEDDARSWATRSRTTLGAWRNVEEARSGLLRNFAVSASRGFFPYWMNVARGFFDDEKVMDLVGEQVPLRRCVMRRPLKHTEHAIAMIIDDRGPLYEDFTSGFQQLAVLQQRVNQLALTGLPYRIHLFSDLQRDDFPKYRAYLFPNLFRLTPQRKQLIREKVMRDGAVAIFGPGTGVIDEDERSAEGVSDLLGIPMEMTMNEAARRVLVHADAHPAVADMRGPQVYGDSYVYGPILQPAFDLSDSEAVELGKAVTHFEANTAGLVLREWGKGAQGSGVAGERGAGDCAVVFSMATPMPASLLRSLALYGGVTPWSDLGDVVAASGGMVAVHSVRGGERTIHLPEPANVRNAMTQELIAQNTKRLTIELDAPETAIFLLDPPR